MSSNALTENFAPNWLPHFSSSGRVPPGVQSFVECQICNKKLAIVERPDGENVEAYTVLPCGHSFGIACIKTWLESADTCPSCRRSLTHRRCGHQVSLWAIQAGSNMNMRNEILDGLAVDGELPSRCLNCKFGDGSSEPEPRSRRNREVSSSSTSSSTSNSSSSSDDNSDDDDDEDDDVDDIDALADGFSNGLGLDSSRDHRHGGPHRHHHHRSHREHHHRRHHHHRHRSTSPLRISTNPFMPRFQPSFVPRFQPSFVPPFPPGPPPPNFGQHGGFLSGGPPLPSPLRPHVPGFGDFGWPPPEAAGHRYPSRPVSRDHGHNHGPPSTSRAPPRLRRGPSRGRQQQLEDMVREEMRSNPRARDLPLEQFDHYVHHIAGRMAQNVDCECSDCRHLSPRSR
ncbi:hypothetical protein F5Y19DRAFT_488778 [Xylariaceae sp. FL1651]|nr:hypothetical protein F5Y19DRAFT_488778 [Xylariaceae sp. FL1651]